MAYKLPPLNTLRLFEAAGRHLSFKEAAAELHVTPSAVSHAVGALEAWLGVPLFVRTHRALELTEAGRAYLPGVAEALRLLAAVTEAVPGRSPSGRLAVSVAPTFGLRWLVPRLPSFATSHPDIEVMLDTSPRIVDLPRDGVDIAIRMGRGGWPGVEARCLVVEELVPVCAPALAARIATPADLAAVPLLHLVNAGEDWAAWAELAGADRLDTDRGQRFDNLNIVLEAAAQGLGVAIGRLPLIGADLRAGRLVPVLGPPRRCRTGYWLVTDRDTGRLPHIAAFTRWIEDELARDRADAAATAGDLLIGR
ncbi:transcriptional regulator GcvA [Caenispirillum bisanense]|uniref:LysR family transcriptional regulator, glycine cleavage system transcriptional activator n=1 Tax=Caenispirillum bisanense TaxID=414052 RepID=A0A286GAV3_9PROT|nr:transcriptional regulator GcvA [Caenispirillum bisanense]SOD92630.1 LysR family transcriptional regulator, glycine cleavage system transcriptional activator [Caenispirillum bisanense]